jgi:uncharacterized protein YjdB
VATVSESGLVTAVGKGTATITVKSNNGKKATCKLTVTVPVKSVKLSQTSITIKEGSTAQLKATVEPTNASNKEVTWKSNDSNIAKVNKSGKITAVKEGKATITVTSVSGKKTEMCSVTVSKKDDSGTVIETDDPIQFSQAVTDLVSGDNFAAGVASNDDFYSKRLIIKAKTNTIDMSVYKPTKTIIGPDNVYILQFDSISAAKSASNELAKRSDIIYGEPDLYISINATPASDVIFSRSTSFNSWGVQHIEADQYAASLQGSTARILVAVADTGVWNHSFLNGRIASGGYDYIDNDNDPTDGHGHGTHVAGTIVDCTPGLNIQILPVRVLNNQGNGTSLTVGNGIKYAADKGAHVVNLSLGGVGHSSYEDDAIKYAINNGSVVVVSAGNDNKDTALYCPAHINTCIVVSAIDSYNNKANFSNYGASVDVAAPGVGILSCVIGGGYQLKSGTSMAAPHVSAIAAMFKLRYPSYSVSQIENLVRTYVMDLGSPGWDIYYGTGVPKLSKALSINPSSISLNKTSLTLLTGQTDTLIATVNPNNAADKSVTWSSSNPAVAIVSPSGVVTAIAAGTATIMAKTVNNLTATCAVTVTSIPPSSISLNKTSLTFLTGQTDTLIATVNPNNAADKTVTWSSSNTAVATVSSSGVVTAIAAGTATITARTVNGLTATCVVTVTGLIGPSSISLNPTSFTFLTGQTETLHATVNPNNAADKTVTWSSSDTAVATVSSSGKVTAIAAGTATITARTVNGLTATCVVTVN